MSTEHERCVAVLKDSAAGAVGRQTAMERLSFIWYGELVDPMVAAGFRLLSTNLARCRWLAMSWPL
jgi:hypothetical protein